MFDEQTFRQLSKYRKYELLRKLDNTSIFRYYIINRNIEYLLFSKWKCGVCGKYMRKNCIEEC